MNSTLRDRGTMRTAVLAALLLPISGVSFAMDSDAAHAVFVMTNDAQVNEVWAYPRTGYGSLENPHHYRTDGRGSGGKVDPLSSQGSLTLSTDREWLFAINAGSGTVSVFHVNGAELELTDRIASGGSEPNAIAQHGGWVYVLNTAGSSSVVGFRFENGKLRRMPDSQRFLSGNNIGSASIKFSPDGRHLVVTERITNSIDVFRVLPDGSLSPIKINPSAGPGAFSATFAPDGAAIVSETGLPGAPGSAISSYRVNADDSLTTLSASVPTLGAADCWNAVTPDGRFVYASNSGSSSIAGFQITAGGALVPVPGTVVAVQPTGAINLDVAITANGKFLYSLNGGNGSVGMFAISASDGVLTNLGSLGGLPAAGGINGIAAN